MQARNGGSVADMSDFLDRATQSRSSLGVWTRTVSSLFPALGLLRTNPGSPAHQSAGECHGLSHNRARGLAVRLGSRGTIGWSQSGSPASSDDFAHRADVESPPHGLWWWPAVYSRTVL